MESRRDVLGFRAGKRCTTVQKKGHGTEDALRFYGFGGSILRFRCFGFTVQGPKPPRAGQGTEPGIPQDHESAGEEADTSPGTPTKHGGAREGGHGAKGHRKGSTGPRGTGPGEHRKVALEGDTRAARGKGGTGQGEALTR